jgi:DNA-binding SARP family transcriptional activator
MTVIELRFFGGFEARIRGDASLLTLPTRKSEAVLAYVITQRPRFVRRDVLTSLLWADVPRTQGRHSLRQTLSRLRHMLAACGGDDVLVTIADAIGIHGDCLWADSSEFERLARESGSDALAQACELYRAPFLDGFTVPERPFDHWMRNERTRLHQLAIGVFSRRLQALESQSDVSAAIPIALRLLELDALQECVHRTLMRMYSRAGQFGSAIRQYELCSQRLKQALGVEPSPETTTLYREIGQGYPLGSMSQR